MRNFVDAMCLIGALLCVAPAAFAQADPAADPALPPAAEPASPDDVASPAPAPAAQALAEEEYVVQAGDTLSAIAERLTGNEGNWRAIAQANQLGDPDSLEVGQRLKIPTELRSM